MNKFRYQKELMDFIKDDWFIQLSITDNLEIIQTVETIYQLWADSKDYLKFINENKQLLISNTPPSFFEKEETVETQAYVEHFLTDIFKLRVEGLYKVCVDFAKTYSPIFAESMHAINELGIDVVIENTFIVLTQQYQKEILEALEHIEIPEEFRYYKMQIETEVNKNLAAKLKDEKVDAAYLVLEVINNIIDGFDEMTIDLDEGKIEMANQMISVLIFYEIVFDKLILLTEHLEYNFLAKICGIDHFLKIGVLERYDQIEILKLMTEEKETKIN